MSEFKYQVPMSVQASEAADDCLIEVETPWSTAPSFELGRQYLVHGTYRLNGNKDGWISLTTGLITTEVLNVHAGQGTFTFLRDFRESGEFLLSLFVVPDESSSLWFSSTSDGWQHPVASVRCTFSSENAVASVTEAPGSAP